MILFGILIFIAAIVLGLIILVQNPKGGGLTGNLAGFSNQFMGVKQTTDVLEKGTWIFAAVVGILCMLSPMFINSKADSNIKNISTGLPTNSKPATPAPATNTNTTAPLDTTKIK